MNSAGLPMLYILVLLGASCASPVHAAEEEQQGLHAYRRTAERRTAVDLTDEQAKAYARLVTLSPDIHELGFNLVRSGGNPMANHSMRVFHDQLATHGGLPGDIEALPGMPDCACFRARRMDDRTIGP